MGFACGRYASSSTHSSADVASLHPGEGKPQQIDLHLRFARLCIARNRVAPRDPGGSAHQGKVAAFQVTSAPRVAPLAAGLAFGTRERRSAGSDENQLGLLSDCTRDLIQSYCLDGIDALCVSAASCT